MSEVINYLKFIVSLIILAFFIFSVIKSKNMWILHVYKKVFTNNPGIVSSDLFPVNHSSKPPGLFSIFSERATGIITIKDNSVSFLGYKTENQPVKISFPINNLEATWLGKLNSLSSTYWFTFKTGDEQHYFCAETGKLLPGNESFSKDLFEKIRTRLNHNVQN